MESLEDRRLLVAGALDTAFGGGDGMVQTDIGGSLSAAHAMELQTDGKIVVGGYYVSAKNGRDFALARFDSLGNPDTTFGSGGVAKLAFSSKDDEIKGLAIQADGKIVVGGFTVVANKRIFALARYSTSGSLDTSFDGDGKVTTDFGSGEEMISDMILDGSGKIVAVGHTTLNNSLTMARYNTNGSLDSSFGTGGKVTLSGEGAATAVALQGDGKIVVTTSKGVRRYNTNGTLHGSYLIAAGQSMAGDAVAIQADGKIVAGSVVVGYQGVIADHRLIRLNSDLTLDTSFGTGGYTTTDWWDGSPPYPVADIEIQGDGKILASGEFNGYGGWSGMAITRINSDGTLDTTFGESGTPGIAAVAFPDSYAVGRRLSITADGRLLAGGLVVNTTEDVGLARFTGDGQLLTAAAAPPAGERGSLTLSDVRPILAEAADRWLAAGLSDSQRGLLQQVSVQVADLPGLQLGVALGTTLTLDTNAAGWGWFVDASPSNDSEFVLPGNQGEQHRMDLLTVVMHELGHLLGHDHDEEGVMTETLAAGVRRTGFEHDQVARVDQVFGQAGDHRAEAWLGAWLSEQFDTAHGRARRRR